MFVGDLAILGMYPVCSVSANPPKFAVFYKSFLGDTAFTDLY
jgi:hypothetical protein